MTQLNRRDVFRVAAAGAATAGAVRAATAGNSPSVPSNRSLRRDLAAAALRGGLPGSLLGLSPVLSVAVQGCRSWSRDVLLTLPDGRTGLVALDATGLALAAAAQLAKQPLFARLWGHEVAAEQGLGRFAGALLAVDPTDLAGLDPAMEV
ncbi:MAG: hypothetical protein JNL12_23345 [Planctomycetes bacterium]|nr:hypothetical protein [Planctomycetota bacterium]